MRGQSTLEYAVFVAVVAAALVAMQVYVRRAIQANLKMLEGQINAEAVVRLPSGPQPLPGAGPAGATGAPGGGPGVVSSAGVPAPPTVPSVNPTDGGNR
ncbi:MAG: hypothetical protein HYY90_04995 [Candidatus Omnitrophica bacterium]|nr:hypothetical protein [Candidatus Omnitrophota bacterium]MBI3020784.1 hypothetical protein [Candidatus Omnitrophota bacterium]MBI3083700.1 hypothetical protein [Candidatus Omnitrophota bacterium]